ncbi:galactonate dehydratase [Thermoplasmatales archaeon]|nr:galactonate dehydratase [Thermoplasmatales archaeon]
MKIKELRTFFAAAVWRNFVIVEVTTDEGIKGYGEGTLGDFEKTVESAVNDLKPFLIGRELNINEITDFFVRHFFWRNGPILSTAQSAIEQALWDAMGKTLKKPVYMLLGGKAIDRVKVYGNGFISGNASPEEFAKAATKTVEMGFHALKFDPFGGSGPNISSENLDKAKTRIRSIRDAVGEGVDLMIEAHGRFNTRTALKIAQEIAQYDPFWFEEPVPEEDIISMAEVRHGSQVPIATGERIISRNRFWELLTQRSADIIQPDVCHMGGILPLIEVGAMANVNYVTVAPHNPNGPVATAASLNALITMPNALVLEFWLDAETVRHDLINEYFTLKDGYIYPSNKPGLGIEVNENALNKYPYQKMHLEYFSEDYKYHGDVR